MIIARERLITSKFKLLVHTCASVDDVSACLDRHDSQMAVDVHGCQLGAFT
jgi:hypothetical protein